MATPTTRELVNFNTPRDILGSVCVKTGKQSIPVKLVFVRNCNKKSEYIIILTIDCILSDSEVIRIYGGRWSIEVFFRATKSLLDLSDELQTICELFYVCCEDIQDIELSTAMKQLLKILCDGIKNCAITITKEIKTQLTNWFVSQPT